MPVVLINPNSTGAMTESALTAARLAAPELCFEGWTSHAGPPAIQGAADGLLAVPPLIDLVRQASDQGAEAIIIACFDDTGLAMARALAARPVIGIGQASFIAAGLLPGDTVVITTVEAAVPVIEANIMAQGQWAERTRVIAAGVPVLTLEQDAPAAAARFIAAAQGLGPGVANIILGCAGAVTISAQLKNALPQTILDGVTAAARLCRVVRP